MTPSWALGVFGQRLDTWSGQDADTSTLVDLQPKRMDMLKMKQAYEIEVYVSDVGYLTFKQEEGAPDDMSSMVLLSYEQTLVLRDYLPELIKQQEEKWAGGVTVYKVED
jgi:hypothetical protein